VHARLALVDGETIKLCLQIPLIAKKSFIEILPPNGTNESFNEWVGPWYFGHGLHFINFKDSKIALPLQKFKKGVMIRAQVAWRYS
jgi:hypothetical protein